MESQFRCRLAVPLTAFACAISFGIGKSQEEDGALPGFASDWQSAQEVDSIPKAESPQAPFPVVAVEPLAQGDSAVDSGAVELPSMGVKPSGKARPFKEPSRAFLRREDLQKVVATQGDPLKAVGTLSGVSNQNDLSVRPFVRGGKAEETQVFWDGIALVQPYHFGSFYSLFHTETIEDLALYSGGFPVEAGNALSGALFLRSRPPPLDSFRLFADISMLRGSIHTGFPVYRDKLSMSLSFQSFWYDQLVNRGMDIIALARNDEGFTRSKNEFQGFVDLPNFRDFQGGLTFRIHESLQAHYTGLYSGDIFVTRQGRTAYFVNNREVSNNYYEWNAANRSSDMREQRRILDTLSAVSVDNHTHGLRLHWQIGEGWEVNPTIVFQSQEWGVGFYDRLEWTDSITPSGEFAGRAIRGPADRRFRLKRQAYDWKFETVRKGEKNTLLLGLSQSLRPWRYDMRMEKPVYEIIANGNAYSLEGLGSFHPDGFVIRRNDTSGREPPDFLKRLPDLVRFDYTGNSYGTHSSAYGSLAWNLDSRRKLLLGLRGDYDSYSRLLLPSPRTAFFQNLGEKDDIVLSAGLYTQGDLPFFMRDENPRLEPEKAVHANVGWTHAFTRHYRMEWQAYHKMYYDLATAFPENTGQVDWRLAGIDSTGFSRLDPGAQDSILHQFGVKRLRYLNRGTGQATGLEAACFYNPVPAWGGWASAEISRSIRRDSPEERSYNFRYGRPWALNWVNHFRMPSRYELSLRLRWAAGLPYTDYRQEGDFGPESDTLFWTGPRNAARYAAYRRVDFRLSKEIPMKGGHVMHSYMEIWNAFNEPNIVMRDSRSGEWKFFDLNYPIPILFLGISYRW